MRTSLKRRLRSKSVTVRLPIALVQHLMRARKIATQSELIHTLLLEEQERCAAETVLRATAGTLDARDFDADLF